MQQKKKFYDSQFLIAFLLPDNRSMASLHYIPPPLTNYTFGVHFISMQEIRALGGYFPIFCQQPAAANPLVSTKRVKRV